MPQYEVGEAGDLFDPDTGEWVGVVNQAGREQLISVSALTLADTLESAATADPASLARIQSSVSGDRAVLNVVQQAQQQAGATTALLSADKLALLDPGGGPQIIIRRYRTSGPLAEVLAVNGSIGDEALVTDLGVESVGVVVRWTGAKWRMFGQQDLIFLPGSTFALAATGETIVRAASLPARFNEIMHGLRLEVGFQKTGTTAAVTGCRVRFGASGLSGVANICDTFTNWSGQRSISLAKSIAIIDATTLGRIGSVGSTGMDYSYSATSSALDQVTIPNMSANTTHITMTTNIANTEQGGAYMLRVTGLS